MTDNEYPVLKYLSETQAMGDFRLKEAMRSLGMDDQQPAEFYRALITESRRIIPERHRLIEAVSSLEQARLKAEETLSPLRKEVVTLRGEVLSLKAEVSRLSEIASEVQESASKYTTLKAILFGKLDRDTLRTLYDMSYQVYTDAMRIEIGMLSQPAVADHLIEELRNDIRDALTVPHDTLEQENKALREQNEALIYVIRQSLGRGR